MKFCTKCGKAMEDNYAVCPYCGSSAEAEESAAADNTNNVNEQNANAYTYNQPPYGQGAPVGGFAPPPAPGNAPEYTPAPKPQKSAYIAAFLALFFGVYGVHDFYLDRKNKGLVKLLLTLLGCGVGVFVSLVLSVIDAIKLLKGEINTDGNGDLIKMGL